MKRTHVHLRRHLLRHSQVQQETQARPMNTTVLNCLPEGTLPQGKGQQRLRQDNAPAST